MIERLPSFTLYGVCTTREESARKAAAVFGAPIWTTSHEDLSARSEIDVIAICVKAPFHYEIAKAALQAGKHVYCEWPLAITAAQAEELAALAASGAARTIIGLHLRGSPVMLQAARMIAEGFVGRVYSVSLQARLFGPVMRAMALRSGGTTLHSIYAGHLLDALDHYFGGIAEIAMRGAVHLPPFDETGQSIPRDAFDHVQFHGVLDHGALFDVDLAGVSMTGLGCTWKIEGSDGVLVLSRGIQACRRSRRSRCTGRKGKRHCRRSRLTFRWTARRYPPNRIATQPIRVFPLRARRLAPSEISISNWARRSRRGGRPSRVSTAP
ncbi:Gfo/Idh/MocA family protein [Novosphingobium sp. P6W]|uniref:Gfo/Idh/MocA family protein n=1 Tax=Novosphingobium sp. P6W TaxID=1609758 RepID=UPI0005C2A71E|nr:Gfo/Idh/MocA family oxidoreductase [Novosphingobium sp. P6W]KIS31594.1 hypothetical protein TQ38_15875 [Novosphingobium sp. P6W]